MLEADPRKMGYIDLQQEAQQAWELRQYRRRRLISGIRGWLRRHAHPRLWAFVILLGSAIPGAAAGYLAARCGLGAWGPAAFLGTIVAWPVFLVIIWHMCGVWAEKVKLGQTLQHYMTFDSIAEDQEYQKMFALPHEENPTLSNAISRGFGEAMGRTASGGGCMVGIFLILVTAGGWLVWQLLKYAPTLFAETILDCYLAQKHRRLYEQVNLEDWKQNAIHATSIYFTALAVVATLLTAYCWVMIPILFPK